MSSEIKLTDDNFISEVNESEIPVLVDFWAPWCGPCRIIGPTLSDVAAERSGKLKVAKYNVDEDSEFAQKFHIQSIPTLILFKNGEVVDKMIGVMSKDMLLEAIDKHL